MEQLETADRRGEAVPEAKVARFKDKIAKLNEEIARLDARGNSEGGWRYAPVGHSNGC